jgi:hypothetical protein
MQSWAKSKYSHLLIGYRQPDPVPATVAVVRRRSGNPLLVIGTLINSVDAKKMTTTLPISTSTPEVSAW